jgi:hypothetical protein
MNTFNLSKLAVIGLVSFAGAAHAQVDVTCTTAITGGVTQNVIVPMGASCTLTDVSVLGNIEVKEMANVVTRRGSINGDVIIESMGSARLNRGNINGKVESLGGRLLNVAGTTIAKDIVALDTLTVVVGAGARVGAVEVLSSGRVLVSGVTIQGDAKFQQNTGLVSASDNSISGNMQVFDNLGGVTMNTNTIRGNMQCKDNLPAPSGAGNVAAIKEDQCAAL